MKRLMMLLGLVGALVFAGTDVGANPAFSIRVSPTNGVSAAASTNACAVEKGRWYYDRDHVAAYIRTFGCLPGNYITKNQARQLGWYGGPVEPYAKGKVIGGDRFGNYERRLPQGAWRECDIDTKGRSRGAKRLIFSSDKRIYYTSDHYQTFRKVQ